jgi:hypothetical protein
MNCPLLGLGKMLILSLFIMGGIIFNVGLNSAMPFPGEVKLPQA